jgi:hypothetical protein
MKLLSNNVGDPDPYDPYVFGPPEPHPDLLVRETDPSIM